MQDENRVPESGKEKKLSEIETLKETITVGIGILRDKITEEIAIKKEAREKADEALGVLDAIYQKALAGNHEALSCLRALAKDALQRAGQQDNGSPEVRAICPANTGRKGRPARKKTCELPDHAVHMENYPENPPKITEHEIGQFLQARSYFIIARANYERRRAGLVYKLQLCCEPEDQKPTAQYLLKLGDDWDSLEITDHTRIPNEVVIDRR